MSRVHPPGKFEGWREFEEMIMSLFCQSLIINKPDWLGNTAWELKNLDEITILFGKNGSGKSQLLRSLLNKDHAIYHYVCPERSGDMTPEFGNSQNELIPNKRAGKRQFNSSPKYRQEVVSRIHALLLKIGSSRSPNSVADILDDIEEDLQILLTDFQFTITEREPFYKLKRRFNDELIQSVNALSSGEAEILALALDILTICALWKLDNQEKKVLLIDEPDTHLHPDLQGKLAYFLVQVLEKYNVQMIIATHSTTLLSALGYEGRGKTSVLYLSNINNEQKAVKFDKSLQELSTCLGGHALMGPLFNAPLLLVEGDDDNRVWNQVPRYHKLKLAVIPCQGADEVKAYQKTLEKIFASLRTDQTHPVGFALLDGDQPLPYANPNNPQTNVKFIKLSCLETENLYLTDEVLSSMGISWEDVKIRIKEQSDKFGEKQQQLNECDSWDRKNTKIKSIILQISHIIDPGVHWTLRVAKCIGSKRPEGQIAEFLGSEVITSIWPSI